MTWKYTLRQLLRTPVKLVLFLLLTAFSVAMLVLGFNLWLNSSETVGKMREAYVTRGTVTQLPDYTDYTAYGYENPIYESEVDWERLSSLPYKTKVENRPTIIAKGTVEGEEVLTYPNENSFRIIRFSPLNDINTKTDPYIEIMGHNVVISGVEYLQGDGSFSPGPESLTLFLHDVEAELYAGEAYIAFAYVDEPGQYAIPQPISFSVSTSPLSNKVEAADWIYKPWSGNFLSTRDGKSLLQYIQNTEKLKENTVSVIPTADASMLDPFFYSEIAMKAGRVITAQEYEKGALVCMIPEALANDPRYTDETPTEYNNNLQVGDIISLDLLGAVYGEDNTYYNITQDTEGSAVSPGVIHGVLPDREISPFDTRAYEIVGIYRQTLSQSSTGLGGTDIIVPSASLDIPRQAIWSGGRIGPSKASFLLENGEADNFRLALDGLGLKNVSVSIDDMGYGEISRGVEAVSLVANILVASGLVGVLCALMFFVYLQVARRRRETAIQISLGAGRGRAAASLLLSVMIVTAAGAGIGSAVGHGVCSFVSDKVYNTALDSAYSREYSDLNAGESREAVTMELQPDPAASGAAGLAVILGAFVITAIFASANLRREPIVMLTSGGDGK